MLTDLTHFTFYEITKCLLFLSESEIILKKCIKNAIRKQSSMIQKMYVMSFFLSGSVVFLFKKYILQNAKYALCKLRLGDVDHFGIVHTMSNVKHCNG